MIQRAIEGRGVPTVSVTVAKDVSEMIKVPRALFMPWPMGHHFGVPFNTALQRKVIMEALRVLQTAEISGTIATLPLKWADIRREAKVLTEQGRSL